MSALQKQPVSIAVEADQMVFQSYKSGVMTGQCGTNLDHGILAVGYGTEDGTDYWLVKNSWGEVWGLQGYGKLERGKGASGECGILMGATFPAVSGSPAPTPIERAFEDFVKEFEKDYSNDVERMQKFENFAANYEYIMSENQKDNKYQLGINAFSDMSPDEFAKTHFGYKKPENLYGSRSKLGTYVYDGAPLADSVDWVAKGAVTPVKNQGQCGSCWSFSTTGALEGAWQIATGNLVSMSEEMLVDCSKQNHGCGGGSMDLAFEYVETSGICTETSYPYTGRASTCSATSCTKALAPGAVTGYHDVQQNSKEALMSALQKQPVSIAVEADQMVFQSYKSGVMTGQCGTNLDHGILAVGYGTESGTDYWLVKNSWGDVWGLQGYGKLERGKGSSGECGILMGATFPAVSGSPGPAPGPSPGPSPPAPPAPPAPSSSHYEKPPCQADEVDAEIQGITGSVCAPKCTNSACPSDVPTGTTDKPTCCLQDSSSGDKYCALECLVGGCPPGAKCQLAGIMGICVYDDANVTDTKKSLIYVPSQVEINV